MTERKLDHSRPPLPFMGSKMRWWRELGRLAQSLPYGACVFDAFGGSMSSDALHGRMTCSSLTNDWTHAKREGVRSTTNCLFRDVANLKRNYVANLKRNYAANLERKMQLTRQNAAAKPSFLRRVTLFAFPKTPL